MMTLAFTLLAVSSYFLWTQKVRWGWAVVLAVLVLGLIIFVRDVDFATNLGTQL
jgi:hypothetical protein